MSERKPPDVGSQVRALRTERGLSMRGLAELCELSPNAISLIERGVTSPSVSTLHRLATALKVPITAFFEKQDDRVELILSRANERPFTGTDSVVLESLGAGLEHQMLEPFVVTLKPGTDSGNQEMAHDGHELVYCLQGELEYEVAGTRYRLAAGDSVLFEARLAHCWRNPGRDPAVFLLIFQAATQGESMEQHLHP
jgi:transcriptional regulator with XRE-family HTH domain